MRPSAVDTSKAFVQSVSDPLLRKQSLALDVLRVDLVHPVISGNKWFKLKYYLEEALNSRYEGIITMGGAYSNHLLATACACRQTGLQSIGIIRGEKPAQPSPTIAELETYCMRTLFVSREQYKNKEEVRAFYSKQFPSYLWVEEGGAGEPGIKGAGEILRLTDTSVYSHIVCAAGTGTMLTGLLNAAHSAQTITGIPVIKISNPAQNELLNYIRRYSDRNNFELLYSFHEGGYARINAELIGFMNTLFTQHQLPTDIVYTGKLLKAVFHLLEASHFAAGSRVLIIHSGGLQGNRSLPPETLNF